MKKVYEAPAVEKIEFQYRDQVVARSGESCREINGYEGDLGSGNCDNPSTKPLNQ